MAVQRKRNPDLEALVLQAAVEIRQANPALSAAATDIGTPVTARTDEEIAAVDAEVTRLWDSPEGQQVRQLGYSAARAVDADRGA